jgi:hypothetical protein
MPRFIERGDGGFETRLDEKRKCCRIYFEGGESCFAGSVAEESKTRFVDFETREFETAVKHLFETLRFVTS